MEATDIEHSLVVDDEFDALYVVIVVVASDSSKLHARRVVEKLDVQNGIIYLPGQVEATWEDSDQGPPFRQRRYFYYLTGADFPGCAATYDIGTEALTLWIPYTPPATILWFGRTPTPQECLARSDVSCVRYVNELPAYLSARLADVKKLYALRTSQLPTYDAFAQVKGKIVIDTTALRPAMDGARVVKSDYELNMIRTANAISSDAHLGVARAVAEGGLGNECELEAAFLKACVKRNAHAQAYPVIVGSGRNASTLHYDANNEDLEGRQLVVLDAGCEWSLYASDITRTLPLSPSTFSAEARAIYHLVHEMQSAVLARVRPGASFRALQLHATRVATRGLLRLGVFRPGDAGDADAIVERGTPAAFFPHGLGHHVGLDVHDVRSRELLRPAADKLWGKRRPLGPGSLRALAAARAGEDDDAGGDVLRPGMVVTVEPGLYFCRPYIEAYFLRREEHAKYIDGEVLDRYWEVGGARVEDCVRVTEDGYENLTTAPKGEELLKILGVA
ncbi:metallopeptidase family M24-domain-containing protein [Xylariomycetidae sp. FL0641]|nr:metallopeptidase family M24-domain-containing protein [Xylariomycetidae sp. FL0641]